MSSLFSKQLFHGTPVTIENFLSWKAKFDAELLEIKKKRMKEEEQAGKNKLSGMTPLPTPVPCKLLYHFLYRKRIIWTISVRK